ncbi:hypothetical protein LOK49_LG09G01786 [Camellia lanceoleosa]|uniref:Uncharacterized protein n=1 Tax=Camellia lanceoleosa TaxID=1840588 RepID=A0ACC0GJI9_9ERIC|nr:hypothetical protein LOK49_LG09G01786 [Camellia lanceoleosa]
MPQLFLQCCNHIDQSRTLSTPPKNLHKRGSSQPHPQSTYVHKAVWDSDAVRLFLELVVKELESDYKGCVHTMTMHGYRAVSKAFQECTGRFQEVK